VHGKLTANKAQRGFPKYSLAGKLRIEFMKYWCCIPQNKFGGYAQVTSIAYITSG